MALASLTADSWLKEGAILVIEEQADVDLVLPAGFTALDRRTWGITQATFAQYGVVTRRASGSRAEAQPSA